MKKLLLCLVLMLVPVGVATACPGRACQCPGVVQAEEQPLVNVDDAVNTALEAMQAYAEGQMASVQQAGPAAQQAMMEVSMVAGSEEEIAVVNKMGEEFNKGRALFHFAMQDLSEGSKLELLSTFEDGPKAAALKLQAAAKLASGGAKAQNCVLILRGIITQANVILSAADDELDLSTGEQE